MNEQGYINLLTAIIGSGVTILIGSMAYVIRTLWQDGIENQKLIAVLETRLESVQKELIELHHSVRRIEEAFYLELRDEERKNPRAD